MSFSCGRKAVAQKIIVETVEGRDSVICRSPVGKVGLISRRWDGDLAAGQLWKGEIVHENNRYFILMPLEYVGDAVKREA